MRTRHLQQNSALAILIRQPAARREHQRMMGDEQIGPEGLRLRHNRFRCIQREENTGNLLFSGTNKQAGIIIIQLRVKRCSFIDPLINLFYLHVNGSFDLHLLLSLAGRHGSNHIG
jgi:hypothetical protein